MKLFLLLVALSSVLCDNFTTIALTEANCILALQYYNSTSFNLLTCYQVRDEIESTVFWSNCTKRCCNPDKVYEQVRSSIENCDQDRRDYNKAIKDNQGESSQAIFKKVLGWILIGALGVLCIFILILIGKIIYYRCRYQSRQAEIVPEAPIFPPVTVPRIQSEVSLSPFRPEANILWIKQRRSDDMCPICLLEDAKIELAKCKHMVHWQCWKEWSLRKKQCALCRQNEISQLKIYCSSCKGAYYTCSNQDLQRLTTCPKIVCDECKGTNPT